MPSTSLPSLIVIGMLLPLLVADLWTRRRRKSIRQSPLPAAPDQQKKATESLTAKDVGCVSEGGAGFDKQQMGEPNQERVRQPIRFVMPSLLLSQSFQHVCPTAVRSRGAVNGFREEFHYATGLRIDPKTYVVTHIIPVRYSQQSAGGLRVADTSNISALARLDQLGLPLLMHFHSHPGFGRDSNCPSATDRAFQERLERGGHAAIGGIFSRDGFVRFFADDLDRFVVEVQGNNVKKVAANEFKLDLDDAPL